MSNFVFVLDTNYQPLNPIQPGEARRLLNQGKAAVYRPYPFTIILKYKVSNPKTQPHQLKIDPGSKVSGLAIFQDDQVILGAELTHRGEEIKHSLESRRAIRRHRINRKTRYSQPRFLNSTLKPRWLPPSLESRVENILTWVKRITRYVPITWSDAACVEVVSTLEILTSQPLLIAAKGWASINLEKAVS